MVPKKHGRYIHQMGQEYALQPEMAEKGKDIPVRPDCLIVSSVPFISMGNKDPVELFRDLQVFFINVPLLQDLVILPGVGAEKSICIRPVLREPVPWDADLPRPVRPFDQMRKFPAKSRIS